MEDCNVNYIPSENGTNEAIIAKITTARLQKNSDAIKFKYLKPKDAKNSRIKNQRILVAEAGEMTYAGKNFGASCLKNADLCRYYIGILDTSSGKMKVTDAHLFNLRPYKNDSEQETEKKNTNVSLMSTIEKSNRLTREFGIKKKKRQLDAHLKNAISQDAIQEILQATIETAQIDETKDKFVSLSATDVALPPVNFEASHSSEVYNFNHVITEEEFELLKRPALELLNASKKQIEQWNKDQILPKYILEHLSSLPKDDDKKVRILVYLSYLFILFDKNSRKKDDRFPDNIPNKIKKKLLNNFTILDKSGMKPIRNVPQRLKDKLAIHILLVCLIIDDFNVDLGQLQRDLVLDLAKLITYARVLLCTITTKKTSEAKTVTMASLKLPLPNAINKNKRRKLISRTRF